MRDGVGSCTKEDMLEHLVVLPRGGLCNRLRAIASAKRLTSRTGARCTIVWDWGDYDALFDDGTEWLPCAPPMDPEQGIIVPGYHHVRHLHPYEGGAAANRLVPVMTHANVVVVSWYVFYAEEEPLPNYLSEYEAAVIRWFPRPHPAIRAQIAAFKERHLPPGTMGMHVRRTDNRRAISHSPDAAYFAVGDRAVRDGRSIFLATDNETTHRIMRERYGDRLLQYPKRSTLEPRWPRETFQVDDLVDDIVDLWLLIGCDFVVGSAASSYSRVAVLLNGSPKSKLLDRPYARIRKAMSNARHTRSRDARLAELVASGGPFGVRPGALDEAAARLDHDDPVLQQALRRLFERAEQPLRAKPASVVDKQAAGGGSISADPRDYVSMAPYFWQDPSKPDGLPYVRRDGEMNPDADGDRYDKRRLRDAMAGIETLAFVYRFTGNEAYAESCARHLRAWFTDETTRMNPHLHYAQVVPGHDVGRSHGVLDGHYLLAAFDAAWLLRRSPHWHDGDQERLLEWARAFLRWLQSSSSGRRESRAANNHGTLYDVQVTHLSLVTGQFDLARRTAEQARKRRVASQIRPDGSQPHELARAEASFYMQYNLAALFGLATRAEHASVDLWRYETDRGAGIQKALDFVVSHLESPETPWPYRGQRGWWLSFYSVLAQAGRVYGDERYISLLSAHPEKNSWELVDLIR